MKNKAYPLYGFMQGDTIGLLIMAHDEEKVSCLANKLKRASHVRVRAPENLLVLYQGRILDSNSFVSDIGFEALDRFDVVGS